LEEEIIDATTEEGKDKWKQLEEEGKAKYAGDPE
jgi:cell division cycle protein 37